MDKRDLNGLFVHEGKIWDKVKKVWRDHKGKIIGGATAVGAAGAAYLGKKEYDKRKKERLKNVAKAYKDEDKMKAVDKDKAKMNKIDKGKVVVKAYDDEKAKKKLHKNQAKMSKIETQKQKNKRYYDEFKDREEKLDIAHRKKMNPELAKVANTINKKEKRLDAAHKQKMKRS